MKPTLLLATLSLVFSSSCVLAKSEIDSLRARCAEQERQIQQLEQENSNLRGAPTSSAHLLGGQTEWISTGASTPSRTTPVSAAEAPKSIATTSESGTYVVKAGDTLEAIARRTGSTAAKLAKANGLDSGSTLHIGQKLKTPAGPMADPSKTPTVAAEDSKPAPAAAGRTYKIQDGDTFSRIAKKQGVSVASLIAANPTVKPTALRAGQMINLGKSAAPASSPVPEVARKAPATAPVISKSALPATSPNQTQEVKNPEPTPQPEVPQEPSPASEKKTRTIAIDGEMTYQQFATLHGTSTDRLNSLNGLDLVSTTVLAKGSELYVPAQP